MSDRQPPPEPPRPSATGASRKRLGTFAEGVAAAYLQRRGYRILQRNAYLRYAEIDLVALHDGMTVLVEVRSRRDGELGSPLLSFSAAKLRHLRIAAMQFLARHPDLPQEARIDVVGVTVDKSGRVSTIDLIENAVQGDR